VRVNCRYRLRLDRCPEHWLTKHEREVEVHEEQLRKLQARDGPIKRPTPQVP
jgi:hypothetical protein